MVLSTGIEIVFAACSYRSNALIFGFQFPPGFIVVFRFYRAIKNTPALAVDHQAEWHERGLCQRHPHLSVDNRFVTDNGFIDQANTVQVFGCHRQHNSVTGLEQWRLTQLLL